MGKEWIKTSQRLPDNMEYVWIAGEMKYDNDKETDYFIGIGWLANEDEYKQQRKFHPDIPEDVDRWETLTDWWEGQSHYKITHWMEIDTPEHPIDIK